MMDLTSGYHQCPIAVDSIPYAAFICFMGVFEWLRLPMGIKPAGSFFQAMMATVFAVLLYVCIEIYLDDMLVHARTFEEYLSNLRKVFQTAREVNLTFNPKKCKFLMDEVPCLGHIISKEGVRMSVAKIAKILDFPLPLQGHHLKSFLGLANYFRSHVPNYGELARPLEAMVKDYKRTKHQRMDWTDQTKQAYTDLQAAIGKCQLLHFLDDTSPIYVMTDASQYGIGAYMAQVVDGVEHPIAFYSKSLTPPQMRWTTQEQECFAIHQALTEWEYLLAGREFVLRCDHHNLQYINNSPSDKVKRCQSDPT
jgi:hypothetical protein